MNKAKLELSERELSLVIRALSFLSYARIMYKIDSHETPSYIKQLEQSLREIHKFNYEPES